MTLRSRWFGILALMLIPVSATPLGLGDITLNSHLNERLDAEIPVSVSGPEELQTLKVTVASADVFERFGVERLDFMEDLRFTVESRPGGQAIVRVRSAQPVVEPFLTFLIEARSSGGRLLREYTVLLDPPMFLPEPEVAEPAPAPPIQPAPSAGVISRPEAQQARPAPRPDRAVTAPASTYGPVRRAETLWGIAEQVRPDGSVSMNQVMVSLYLANPDAFDGNINRLRAGARLRVPDFTEMTRLSRAEAAAEVRRHNTEWRGGRVARGGPAAAEPAPAPAAAPREEAEKPSRLELVPPARETEAAPGPGAVGETPAEAGYRAEQEALNEELLAAVQSLRRELEETRQLIGIKDGEIASLQERLAGLEDQGVPVAPAPTEGAAGPAEPETPAAQPEAAAPQESAAPAPAPATEPVQPKAQLASEEEGGIFSSLWTWLLIIVVALLGAAVAWKRRQGGETEDYRSWAADEGIEPEPATAAAGAGVAGMATAGTAGALAEGAGAPRSDEPIFAEEPEPEPEPKPAAEPETPVSEPATGKAVGESADDTGEYAYPFEDTIAGATGINLEQSDPLAEADFHMAYGLYDQAAELIQKAIDREPDRTDLRMKLLDILFVWGKQDEFLSEAQNLKGRLGDEESSDWDRVAIMGRQICPDEALFETGGQDEADTADSDVDFELGEDTRTSGEADSIDFDLGATGEMPAIEMEEDETVTGPDATAELEIEDLGLDIDLPEEELPRAPEETGATVAMESVEEPEEETGKTEVLEPAADTEEPAEETGMTEILEGRETAGPGEEETGLTEVLDRVDEAADDQTAVVRARDLDLVDLDSDAETKEMPALSEAAPSGDDTAEVEALDEDDLNLDDLTRSFEEDDLDKTAEIPVAGQGPEGESLIEEIFGEEDEEAEAAAIGDIPTDAGDLESTRELPQPKPSDVTLSEVGTKLDLARAYLDMGDPDGARSILEEVVEEGDDAQQKEARELLDGLS